jgi:hypothetical protein
MADPIDLLETPTADPNPPTNVTPSPTPLAAGQVAISADELAQLRFNAEAYANARPTLERLQQQQQQTPVTPAVAAPSTDDQFWSAPSETAKKIFNDQISPYAKQMAGQLGTMVINTFKSQKTSDRFFAGVMPFFEKKVGAMDASWLGGLNAQMQGRVLEEAWLAAKGAYLTEAEKAKPVTPTPTNLGGTGNGGGPRSQKKTLQQIDETAYRWAVQKGWSQERMDQAAADLQAMEQE